MISGSADRHRDDAGASVVEFAIVLPVLILLLFGIIQFGFAFFRLQGLQAGAREGARFASLSQSTVGDIEARVTNALSGVTFESTPTITITPSNGGQPCNFRTGDTVVVSVSAPNTIDIPLWGTQTVTLTGRGEFRCE